MLAPKVQISIPGYYLILWTRSAGFKVMYFTTICPHLTSGHYPFAFHPLFPPTNTNTLLFKPQKIHLFPKQIMFQASLPWVMLLLECSLPLLHLMKINWSTELLQLSSHCSGKPAHSLHSHNSLCLLLSKCISWHSHQYLPVYLNYWLWVIWEQEPSIT